MVYLMVFFLSTQRLLTNFTDAMEEEAVGFLRHHPSLYDKATKGYWHKRNKDRVLQLLADHLNVEFDFAKNVVQFPEDDAAENQEEAGKDGYRLAEEVPDVIQAAAAV